MNVANLTRHPVELGSGRLLGPGQIAEDYEPNDYDRALADEGTIELLKAPKNTASAGQTNANGGE
jgi:hypothetical protein